MNKCSWLIEQLALWIYISIDSLRWEAANKWFGFILGICTIISLTPNLVEAATIEDSSVLKLEQKFFQHTYAKDTMQSRLERIEKTVFGETKAGSEQDRLSSLLQAVPNLNGSAEESQPSSSQEVVGEQPSSNNERKHKTSHSNSSEQEPIISSSNYPAVTAIEQKLFGKNYAVEPVNQRLSRLETKVFGKTSNIEDLSERVDRLKQKTGVDVIDIAQKNSDWADEDDDQQITPTPRTAQHNSDDGRSFNGRDLRQDFKSMATTNHSRYVPRGSSGAYGMGNYGNTNSNYSNGRYGMGSSTETANQGNDVVPFAPSIRSSKLPSTTSMPQPAPAALGLNQQVTALESEIFGKNYMRDPLPARLNRLESTVFPQDKPATDKSLPDRVSRLISVVPISNQLNRRMAQGNRHNRQSDADFDDTDWPNTAPSIATQPRGFSKIINSLSNFFTGSYSVPSANLLTDPSTGMLYDSVSGNLIDPSTGMVVGRRGVPAYAPPISGYNSFNSGFSPFGSFGAPSTGLGGIRFGIGGGHFSGLWP